MPFVSYLYLTAFIYLFAILESTFRKSEQANYLVAYVSGRG